jgi:hypothetical protein
MTRRNRPARHWLQGEPDVEEMLQDPVVQLVMRRDGLTPQMLRRVLRAGGERLLSAPAADHLVGDEGSLALGRD